MRSMFDAIAPRYDLVNRVMTFRMDVGWRRRTVRDLRLGPGSLGRSTWPAAPATSAASSTAQGLRPDRRRPLVRHAGRRPHRRAAGPGRRPAPARARRRRSTASPAGSPCATSSSSAPFFAELARVVRPGGRIALLEVAEPANPVLRWGHGIYFGKVVPLVGGLLSDPAAYRYLPKSVAYLPEPDAMLGQPRPTPGFVRRRAPPALRRASPSSSPPPARSRAGERPTAARLVARTRRLDPDLDLLAVAGDDGVLFVRDRTGLAGVGVAARIALPRAGGRADADAVAAALGGHRGRRRGRRCPAPGPWPSARCRSTPPAPAELVVPERRRGPGRRRHPLGHHHRPADDEPRPPRSTPSSPGLAGPSARPRRRAHRRPTTARRRTSCAPSAPADWCDAVAEATRAHPGRRRPARSCWPGRSTSSPTGPLRAGAVLGQLRRSYPGCHLFSRRRVRRRQPRAARRPGRRRGAGPPDGRHRAPQRRPHHRRPPGRRPARLDQRPRRAPITIDMVHDTLLPWCSYLDDEAEPSIVAVANVQHLATRSRAGSRSPAAVGARAGRGPAPHPGRRRRARGTSPWP